MNLRKLIKNLIQLIVIGAILVMTKRNFKFLFWPLFVLLSVLLSPWILLIIILIIQVIICDFILGLNVELIKVDWVVFPIWILTYVITTPALYKAITTIEEEWDGKPTFISNSGIFFGYLWGLAATIFVLYRLDFFEDIMR